MLVSGVDVMPIFADIHNHSLFGVDDGAKTQEEAERMIAASYAEGVRFLCLTPHCHPGYFSTTKEKTEAAFSALLTFVRERYPDLTLSLGSEVFGYSEGLAALENGTAATLGGGRTALFEFHDSDSYAYIRDRLLSAQASGYLPVLAHAERYDCLYQDIGRVAELVQHRIAIQINASTLTAGLFSSERRFVRRLLRKGLVAIVASDAHDLVRRPPALLSAYAVVCRICGTACADRLFYENPRSFMSVEKKKEKV